MSKKLIFGLILSFICVFGVQYGAYAWDSGDNWSSENCFFVRGADGDPGEPEHCRTEDNDKIFISSDGQDFGYNTISFNTCSGCKDGYRLEEKGDWITNNGYGCDVTYNICVPECPNYVDCPDGYKDGGSTFDSCNTNKENSCYKKCPTPCQGQEPCPANATCTWDETSGTSETKAYYPNSCSTSSSPCPIKTITCKEDHYKNGNSCDSCPLADDIYTDKNRTIKAQYESSTGATSKSQCYLLSWTTYYDAKGTFTFNATCNYK